ncbi:AraC family transcriptional regulator [Falsiroseomonas sp. HW251]|uniref:AraC family transcriptional regulator n=1 Tax=Falsiroseomonas sp. HW251 TaxID=3390998 RepID=UPI003D31665F
MRNDAGGAMDAVSIQDEPALRLAAMAHQGPYTGIGAVFEHLMAWGVGRGLVGPETRFIGLFLDDPANVPAERLRSNACMTVPEGVATRGEGVRVIFPRAQRLAVTLFRGPYAELPAAYDRIRTWMAAQGLEADRFEPCREEYLNDCRALPPAEWLTRVMVPLKG